METSETTILVFGVSGIGKSTAVRTFVARNPGYLHMSAGRLLRNAKGVSAEDLRTAEGPAVRENQTLLAHAMDAERASRGGGSVILDAHSVIDNDRELVPVSVDIIRALNPSGLIFLKADPETVSSRRMQDHRERPLRSSGDIAEHQRLSESVVKGYAKTLGIPLMVVDASNDVDIGQAVNELRKIGR